jgi:hypothetical protein
LLVLHPADQFRIIGNPVSDELCNDAAVARGSAETAARSIEGLYLIRSRAALASGLTRPFTLSAIAYPGVRRA